MGVGEKVEILSKFPQEKEESKQVDNKRPLFPPKDLMGQGIPPREEQEQTLFKELRRW